MLIKPPHFSIRFFLALAALAFTATACQLPAPPESTPEPSDVLFQDDFSDPSSGWDRVVTETGETDYMDGVYRIYVNQPGTDIWATPGLHFTDVRIEVDAVKVGGPDDNDFGVICRAGESDTFYFFLISSDGYYYIGKHKDGQQIPIGIEAMQPSEDILQGEATNHIRADCIGDTFTLYVNGVQLDQVTDDEFPTGDVGLIAGTFDTPGTLIHFDNFTVLRP